MKSDPDKNKSDKFKTVAWNNWEETKTRLINYEIKPISTNFHFKIVQKQLY